MKQITRALKQRAAIEALVTAGVLLAVVIIAYYISENAFWNHIGL